MDGWMSGEEREGIVSGERRGLSSGANAKSSERMTFLMGWRERERGKGRPISQEYDVR